VNTATSCTGACLGPEAPVITEVRDVDPCALSGIQAYYDKGISTLTADLRKDGVNAVTNYAAGTTYAPGDSSSHDYTVRGNNSYGFTDSSPATAGTDAIGTGTPTFTCTPGTCTDPTSVLLTSQSGYSLYQWARSGIGDIVGATSSTYTATVTDTYTVRYKIGACTNTSAGTLVTITPVGGNPPAVPNNGDVAGTPLRLVKNGANVDVTWDATCINDTEYRLLWGDITSLSLVSGVTNGTVTSATCSLGTTGSATNQTSPSPSAGQCFFAVIDAINGVNFGRHGNNTAGNERILAGDTTFCGATTKNTTATTCN
jgi:hypothetical protein